jgi:transposase
MSTPTDPKSRTLAEHGSLNPRPEAVADEQFQAREFFDPRDVVQVKYEMLRRVRIDGFSVTRAAAGFGFSRPAFYLAKRAFEQNGLPGLVPQRPGPRHAHKLTDAVMNFIIEQRAQDRDLAAPALAQLVREHFGLSVHARSIERALSRWQKKGR